MGDPTPEIESELGRHIVTQEQANEHRKRLNESFAKTQPGPGRGAA